MDYSTKLYFKKGLMKNQKDFLLISLKYQNLVRDILMKQEDVDKARNLTAK